MKLDEAKATLKAADVERVQKAHAAAVEELLNPLKPRANVVGIGTGVKWKNGQPTGEPALLVLVSQKLPQEQLSTADLVAPKVQDIQTDVLAVGELFAGEGQPVQAGTQTLAKRVRPAEGGYSVGHYQITAGTIATCVYDILAGGTISPPTNGVGVPPRYYILSNNHVNSNRCFSSW